MPDTRTQWQLFQQVTAIYPRKQDLARGWVAWQAIRPPADEALLRRMLETLAWQCRDPAWTQDGGRWVPWLRTWLTDRRWEDEPFEPPSAMAVRQKPRSRGEAISQQNAETIAKVLARRRTLPEA